MASVILTGLEIKNPAGVQFVQNAFLERQGVVAQEDNFLEPGAGRQRSKADNTSVFQRNIGVPDRPPAEDAQRPPAGRVLPSPIFPVAEMKNSNS